jgi:hypothetical protein
MRGHPALLTVSHHHQAGAHDREERQRPAAQRTARTGIGRAHGAEGADDVAEMSAIEGDRQTG